jgi:hypothetical protein
VARPTSAFRIPFGKYKGTLVGALPDDYLHWLATREDLRDPLRTAVMRECRVRGQAPDTPPRAGRLPETQPRGFFVVAAGREAEAKAYHARCAATETPSVCVSRGEREAMIAVVFFGPAAAAHVARLLPVVAERWQDYAPQQVTPRSIVLIHVPAAEVEEVALAFSTLAREVAALPAAPAREQDPESSPENRHGLFLPLRHPEP